MRRFRPIVLTALASVLAMIPLSRSIFFGPMAVAIMGGLVVATALTLLFLPALYAAWFRVREGGALARPGWRQSCPGGPGATQGCGRFATSSNVPVSPWTASLLSSPRWDQASGLADFPELPVLASRASLDYLGRATPPAVLPSQFRHAVNWTVLAFDDGPFDATP